MNPHSWEPMDLCRCTGSNIAGWTTGILAFGMLIWYAAIASRWWDAAKSASPEGRKVWQWLVAIFVICAIAGYGSWILALFFPKTAVITRIIFLAAQNIACPMFWRYATKRRFTSISRYESVGEQLAKALEEPNQLDDRQLASLTRQLVAKSLERHADSQ